LDRYCKIEKGDFIGRAALERAKAAGVKRTLVGIEMIDRGIARDEYCCCDERGERIGVVTSGSPSPTLGKNIALAYVPPPFSAIGTIIYVEIRGQKYKAQVVATPFYKRPKKQAAASGEFVKTLAAFVLLWVGPLALGQNAATGKPAPTKTEPAITQSAAPTKTQEPAAK